MSDAPTLRSQRTLVAAVIVLLGVAIACGAIGVYAGQRPHPPAPVPCPPAGATSTPVGCVPADHAIHSYGQGGTGPIGYDSRWYWFTAAGATFVAMLVTVSLIATRTRSGQGKPPRETADR